jgi:hypothetical protein
MKSFIISFLLAFIFFSGYGQYINRDQYTIWTGRMGVGIPSSITPNSSSHLQLGDSATTRALWLPRVQTTSAITAPRQGMLVYSISDSSIYYRDLDSWVRLSALSTNIYTSDGEFPENRTVSMNGYTLAWDSGYTVFGAEKEIFGTRYTYNTSTITTSISSATITVAADGITMSGGDLNLNNFATIEDSIASHFWEYSGSFVVNSKNSTSNGVGFSLVPMNHGQGLFVKFALTDTAAYISYNLSNTIPVGVSTSTLADYDFVWNNGDTLLYNIKRVSYKAYLTLTNKANGSSLSLTIPQIQTTVHTLRIHQLGGSWKVLNDLTLTYNDIKNPKIANGGNSISTGLTALNEGTRWQTQAYSGQNYGVLDMSGATEQSTDALYKLKDIIAYAPRYFTYEWSVNDRNAGVNINTFKSNVTTFIDTLIAHDITPIIFLGIPQNSGSMVQYNDTLISIANARGLMYVDTYTPLLGSGTNLNSKYDFGDGIHLNQEGSDVYAGIVRNFFITNGLLDLASPVQIRTLPITTTPYYILGADAHGNIMKSIEGTNAGYIWNQSTLDGNYKQPANININGTIWGNKMAIGPTPQTGGYFSVNKDEDGITYISDFRLPNNTVIINPSTFFIAGRTIQMLMNGPTTSAFQPSSQGFIIRQAIPATPNVNLVVNTTTGNTIPANYRIAAFGINADTAMIINRDGGIEADTVHKYRADLTSLILANPRNIPDVGTVNDLISDSLAAISGGNNIYNTNGTLTGNRALTGGSNSLTFTGLSAFSSTATTTTDIIAGSLAGEYSTVDMGTTSVNTYAANATNSKLTGVESAVNATPITRVYASDGTFNNYIDVTDSIRETGNSRTIINDTTNKKIRVVDVNTGTWSLANWPTVGGGGGANTALSNLASVAINTTLLPGSNDGAALGSGTLAFSDLFLASGGIINFNNGNFTITHAAGQIEMNGNVRTSGSFRLTGAGSGFQINDRANPTNLLGTIYGTGTSVFINVNSVDRMTFLSNGNIGIGVSPTAALTLKAGTATASTAPLKFTSGTSLTTPEAGAIEFDGTNFFVTASTTRYTVAKTLTSTATLDFGNTAASSSTDLTITVTGAADGDPVVVTPPNGSVAANAIFTAWVSAANTVTVRFSNLDTVNAADPASGTFRAEVVKY